MAEDYLDNGKKERKQRELLHEERIERLRAGKGWTGLFDNVKYSAGSDDGTVVWG